MKNVEKMLKELNEYCSEKKYYSACIIAKDGNTKPKYSLTGETIGLLAGIKLLLQQACESTGVKYEDVARFIYFSCYEEN